MGVRHYSGQRARDFLGWMVSGLYRWRLAIGKSSKKGHFWIMFGAQHPHKRAIWGGQVAHRYRWRISLPGRHWRPPHGPVLLGKAKRGKQFLNSDFLRA